MKHITTKKLFYKKYPYKIVFSIRGAWMLGRLGLIKNENINIIVKKNTWVSPIFSRAGISDIDKLMKFIGLITPFLNFESIKHRSEYNTVSLFLENSNLIPNIKQALGEFIKEIWQPTDDSTSQFLKENINTIICKKLPFNLYTHKVSIRQTLSDEHKQSFYNWAVNKNKTEVSLKFPNSFVEYLTGERLWTGSNYFYLKDENDLIFLSLILDKHILKIEKYQIEKGIKELNILSSKDNIDAGIEQTI